jgi:hypothetical protein
MAYHCTRDGVLALARSRKAPHYEYAGHVVIRDENFGLYEVRRLYAVARDAVVQSFTRQLPTSMAALEHALRFDVNGNPPENWPGAWSQTLRGLAWQISIERGIDIEVAKALATWILRDVADHVQGRVSPSAGRTWRWLIFAPGLDAR